MILELIPLSRLKRELNQVLRKLARGNPDVYIINNRGNRVAYIDAPVLFQTGMELVDHVELDATLRGARQHPNEIGVPSNES